MRYIALVVGGMIGGILRYLVDLATPTSHLFFLGTLFSNLSGALCLGFFQAFVEGKRIPDWVRIGFVVGLVGSYTTMSTFCLETDQLIGDHSALAIPYGLCSIICGPLCAYFGYELHQSVRRRRVAHQLEENAL